MKVPKVKVPKETLVYAGIVLWGFLVMTLVVLLFFPYQRAFRIASQNVLGGSRMIVSVEGGSLGFLSAEASKIVVGHAAVEGKPILELRKVSAKWYPLSLLTGKLNIFSKATAYDGTVQCILGRIPVIVTANPVISIKFDKINLAKYPEGTLPWFKAISGTMSGWIQEEAPLVGSDRQRGSFRIAMTAGEIKELQVKGFPGLILGYNEVVAEGKISGSRIQVDRIHIEGNGLKLRGSGFIDRGGPEPRINLRLICQASSKESLLANGAVITVTGNQWSPTITVSDEPTPQSEQTLTRTQVPEQRPLL